MAEPSKSPTLLLSILVHALSGRHTLGRGAATAKHNLLLFTFWDPLPWLKPTFLTNLDAARDALLHKPGHPWTVTSHVSVTSHWMIAIICNNDTNYGAFFNVQLTNIGILCLWMCFVGPNWKTCQKFQNSTPVQMTDPWEKYGAPCMGWDAPPVFFFGVRSKVGITEGELSMNRKHVWVLVKEAGLRG